MELVPSRNTFVKMAYLLKEQQIKQIDLDSNRLNR